MPLPLLSLFVASARLVIVSAKSTRRCRTVATTRRCSRLARSVQGTVAGANSD